jgi:copper chaperone CopZ
MITLKTMIGLVITGLLIFTGLAVMQNESEHSKDSNASEWTVEEYDIEVEVSGLHCSLCDRRCRRSLERLEQVESAEVKRDQGVVLIKLKPDQIVTKEQIVEAIEDAGFQAGEFKKFPESEQNEES